MIKSRTIQNDLYIIIKAPEEIKNLVKEIIEETQNNTIYKLTAAEQKECIKFLFKFACNLNDSHNNIYDYPIDNKTIQTQKIIIQKITQLLKIQTDIKKYKKIFQRANKEIAKEIFKNITTAQKPSLISYKNNALISFAKTSAKTKETLQITKIQNLQKLINENYTMLESQFALLLPLIKIISENEIITMIFYSQFIQELSIEITKITEKLYKLQNSIKEYELKDLRLLLTISQNIIHSIIIKICYINWHQTIPNKPIIEILKKLYYAKSYNNFTKLEHLSHCFTNIKISQYKNTATEFKNKMDSCITQESFLNNITDLLFSFFYKEFYFTQNLNINISQKNTIIGICAYHLQYILENMKISLQNIENKNSIRKINLILHTAETTSTKLTLKPIQTTETIVDLMQNLLAPQTTTQNSCKKYTPKIVVTNC